LQGGIISPREEVWDHRASLNPKLHVEAHSIPMKFSMTGLENYDLLIQVTA
jgi:hypothetical protein